MSDDTRFLRVASQWLIAITLALALLATFMLVTAVQVTSEGTGQRILRRGVAVTADLDRSLPQLEGALHQSAETSAGGPTVRLPNFPIPVNVPADQAATIGGGELRALILDQSARRLYEDGPSAWADSDEAANQNIERVSTAGALHRGFGFITDTWHKVFIGLAIFAGLVSLILAVMLMIAVSSYMRVIALGAVTAGAAIPSLAAAVGVRFALRTAETEADAFEAGLIDLGVDTTLVFIRNYLLLSILGFAILALGSLALWLQSRVPNQTTAASPGVPR